MSEDISNIQYFHSRISYYGASCWRKHLRRKFLTECIFRTLHKTRQHILVLLFIDLNSKRITYHIYPVTHKRIPNASDQQAPDWLLLRGQRSYVTTLTTFYATSVSVQSDRTCISHGSTQIPRLASSSSTLIRILVLLLHGVRHGVGTWQKVFYYPWGPAITIKRSNGMKTNAN